MIRSALRLVPVLVALALAGGATAHSTGEPVPTPISVDQLLASDVTVAPGATLTADERARLEQSAKELATPDANGESFPTRFVIVPAPKVAHDLTDQARTLRSAGTERLGDGDQLDAVILLAPRAIGISANAFQTEIADAITAERPTLERDRVAGTIAVAKRLQALDAANVLPGDASSTSTSDSKSRTWFLLISTAVILLIIVGGIVFNRRTVARRNAGITQEEADRERAQDDGAPPPEMRQ